MDAEEACGRVRPDAVAGFAHHTTSSHTTPHDTTTPHHTRGKVGGSWLGAVEGIRGGARRRERWWYGGHRRGKRWKMCRGCKREVQGAGNRAWYDPTRGEREGCGCGVVSSFSEGISYLPVAPSHSLAAPSSPGSAPYLLAFYPPMTVCLNMGPRAVTDFHQQLLSHFLYTVYRQDPGQAVRCHGAFRLGIPRNRPQF